MSDKYDWRLAGDRLAILGALNTAVRNPKIVIDLVAASGDKAQAVDALVSSFGWSTLQAKAVLNLQVGQWSEAGRSSLAADLADATRADEESQ